MKILRKKWCVVLSAVIGSLLLAGRVSATDLLGAGATFPYPLYAKMFDQYNRAFGTKINYQAIGSGGGIRQLKNKTVDFGASDAYLSDDDLHSMGRVLHVPICLGAVAISYNLPGVTSLKLTSETLSEIFLGKITKWNDAKIQAINDGVALPDMAIFVVHRADGSGTSAIFTDYLSKVSRDWDKKVGKGTSPKWPVGLGGKGNAGVAAMVQQVPGAIGYVELIYAAQNKMAVAQLQNKSGVFLAPSLASTSAAADVEIPSDTRVSITNTAAKDGYPICGFTWILIYKDQNYGNRSIETAKQVGKLVSWMIADGQALAEPMGYAPLPKRAAEKARLVLGQLTFGGSNVL